MIDLHVHTTASDGLCEPPELVRRASLAGLTVLGVTDHDTTAGVSAVSAAAAQCGLTVVPGIEVTAVDDGRDVHILGYFIDPASPSLAVFLASQRADRVRRAIEIADRLRALGCPIDVDALLAGRGVSAERAIARPQIAAALVRAGHVSSTQEAFDRFLGEDRPAYVAREGAPSADVVAVIARAGGIASLAHPGVLARDDLIPPLVAAGLSAIEVYHSDHDEDTTSRYLGVARAYGLAISGGSDYHGDDSHRQAALGAVVLPEEHYWSLRARAGEGREGTTA